MSRGEPGSKSLGCALILLKHFNFSSWHTLCRTGVACRCWTGRVLRTLLCTLFCNRQNKMLGRCEARYEIGVRCRATICKNCIVSRVCDMCCPIHQKRPSGTRARLFVTAKSCCWVCRDDSRWTKACVWCCKSMCPKCRLFDEVRNGVPFTCNGCCLTREEQTAPILLQLLTLVLNCTCVACTAPENFRLDTLADCGSKKPFRKSGGGAYNFPTMCTTYGMLDFTRSHVDSLLY